MTANKARRPARPNGDGERAAGAEPAPLPTSYEQARDELASVVATLEEGGLTLDESLTLWERGQALAAACEKFLAGARARVDDALARAERPGDEDDENQDEPDES